MAVRQNARSTTSLAGRAALLEWRAERLGWTLMALCLAAALFGLTGPSKWTRVTVSSPRGACAVTYYAIERRDAATEIRFRLDPAESDGVLALSRPFAEGATVEDIVPMPLGSESSPNGVSYRFEMPRDHALEIVLRLRFRVFGRLRYDATCGDSSVGVSQFILP